MALWNLCKLNPGTWVIMNPMSADDGFGNLIPNSPCQVHMAAIFYRKLEN